MPARWPPGASPPASGRTRRRRWRRPRRRPAHGPAGRGYRRCRAPSRRRAGRGPQARAGSRPTGVTIRTSTSPAGAGTAIHFSSTSGFSTGAAWMPSSTSRAPSGPSSYGKGGFELASASSKAAGSRTCSFRGSIPGSTTSLEQVPPAPPSVASVGTRASSLVSPGPDWDSRLGRLRQSGRFGRVQRRPELAAGRDAELGEHLVEVVLGGSRADEQLGADLGVRATLGRQPGDLGLLRREPSRASSPCACARSRRSPAARGPPGPRTPRRRTRPNRSWAARRWSRASDRRCPRRSHSP